LVASCKATRCRHQACAHAVSARRIGPVDTMVIAVALVSKTQTKHNF
jgi:hypothetical protein